jgi:uncharacterized CHY-type Zn-finger protein
VDKHANKLVEEYFDIKAAEKIFEASKTHNIAKVGKASGPLSKTCSKCHAELKISVWTKFHWPSFHKIKVIGPISKKEMAFNDYMDKNSSSFKGVQLIFGKDNMTVLLNP